MNAKFVNKTIVTGITLATMGSGLVGLSTAYADAPQADAAPVVKKETPKKKSFSEIAHQVQTYDAAVLHPNATQEELDKLYPTTKDSKSKVTVKDVKEVKEQIENKTYGKDPKHVPTVHEILPDVDADKVLENAGKLKYPDMKDLVKGEEKAPAKPVQPVVPHDAPAPEQPAQSTPAPVVPERVVPIQPAGEVALPKKAAKADVKEGKLPQTSDPFAAAGAISSISGFLALAGAALARKRMK